MEGFETASRPGGRGGFAAGRQRLAIGVSGAALALALTGAAPPPSSVAARAAEPERDAPFAEEAGADLQTWLETNTAIPLGAVIAVSDGVLVAFAPSEPEPETGPARVARVLVQQEALSEAAADRQGGRSVLTGAQVDCLGERVRVESRRIYEGADLTGEVTEASAAGDWLAPERAGELRDVFRSFCDPSFRRPGAALAGMRMARDTVSARPTKREAQPAAGGSAPSEDTVALAAAQTRRVAEPAEPAPAAHMSVASPRGRPASTSTVVALEPARSLQAAANTEPSFDATRSPGAAAASPVTVTRAPGRAARLSGLRGATSPAPARVPIAPARERGRAPTRPAAMRLTGGWSVQVGAFGDEAQARAGARSALASLGSDAPARIEVEPAQVNGRSYRRGLLTGFGSESAAQRACQALRRAGRACLVRRAS